MSLLYVVAALVVVPALLGAFHLLSRPPEVTSQPAPAQLQRRTDGPKGIGADRVEALDLGSLDVAAVADEAERWLRTQSSS